MKSKTPTLRESGAPLERDFEILKQEALDKLYAVLDTMDDISDEDKKAVKKIFNSITDPHTNNSQATEKEASLNSLRLILTQSDEAIRASVKSALTTTKMSLETLSSERNQILIFLFSFSGPMRVAEIEKGNSQSADDLADTIQTAIEKTTEE